MHQIHHEAKLSCVSAHTRGGGGGPTLFLSVDFVNILPKKGGGQTFMSTKALTKL